MPRTIGKPDLCRLRVRMNKDGRLAFLGHIELINTVMRSVRRAGLPFSVGNGFARRMRVQFSQALPVGAASRDEYYDVYLNERVDADVALAALVESSPAALAPTAACYVQGRLPALEAWLTRSKWEVDVYPERGIVEAAALDQALADLREQGSIDFMRGDKPRTIGLDDTLVDWSVSSGERGGVHVSLDTRSSNLGALRPAVLLEAAFGRESLADCPLDSLRVERTAQWHEDEGGARVDAMAPELRV